MNPNIHRTAVTVASLAAIAAAGSAQAVPSEPVAPSPAIAATQITFTENRGQWPSEVAFRARRGSAAAWLVPGGVVLSVELFEDAPSAHGSAFPNLESVGGAALRLGFDGANVRPEGVGLLPGVSHFRYPHAHVYDAAHFERARYRELWPGVDALVRSDGNFVAYDLHLGAEASLAQVSMTCEGDDGLSIDAEGGLVMQTSFGPIRQSRPVAWYVLPDGDRRFVDCDFRLVDPHRYGFELRQPREPLPLVIDPSLSWSTLVGGSLLDWSFGMEVDDNTGFVHLCGQTYSADFPTTMGPLHAGTSDAYVTVLDPAAPSPVSMVVWSMFFGGPGLDLAMGLDVDNGMTAVVGFADPGFPSFSTNAFQPGQQGSEDAFALLLDPAGVLLSGTFFGTASTDWAVGVQATGSFQYAVLGYTHSSSFPVSGTLSGGRDQFVLEWAPFAAGAAQNVRGTYLGGSGDEGYFARASNNDILNTTTGSIEVDQSTGEIYVASHTKSTNYPVTAATAFQPTLAGSHDGVLTVLDASMSMPPVYASYCGGVGGDVFLGLGLHPAGGVVLVGYTGGRSSFPRTPGAIDYGGGGAVDATITWLDPALPGIAGHRYGGVMGGSGGDVLTDASVAISGIVTAVGSSGSGTGFPYTRGAFDTSPTGVSVPVALRMKLASNGLLDLYYSSKFGSQGAATSVDLDDRGIVTFAGMTMDPVYPTTNGSTGAGNQDVLVTRLDMMPTGLLAPASVSRTGPDTPACGWPIYTGVDSAPYPGNAGFHVNVSGAPPRTPAVVLFGTPVQVPLPAPFNTTLLVSGSISVLVGPGTDALGFAEMALPIPPGFSGATIDLQWAFLTNAACPGNGLVAASERMRL